MFNVIEDFYDPSDLGLITLNFLNLPFHPVHQPRNIYYSDRTKAYPCYETDKFFKSLSPTDPVGLFKKTFENKTNLKIISLQTFFRKTILEELKKAPSWKQYRTHKDSKIFDLAGVIYFNSNSLKDGTYIYNKMDDYEPTTIIGSRCNRAIFYSTQQPHCASMEQEVKERWIQPFFVVYKQETYDMYKENYGT